MISRVLPMVARVAAVGAPGARRLRRRFDGLRRRFYAGLWQEAAAAVGAELEELGDGYRRLRREGATTLVRRDEVMLDSHLLYVLAGNKPMVHRLLGELGLPVPRHLCFGLDDLKPARRFLSEVDGPCVVKPARDSGAGAGVTTGVRGPGALALAALRAAAGGPELLLEEQVPGSSYRLLFLRGELLHAVRRDPPAVEGDGRSTLAELVAAENGRRLADGPVRALSPLLLDLESRRWLAEQSWAPDRVPAAGQRVRVKRVVNQNAAEQNVSVTDEVHPELRALGRRIYAAIGVELAGVDLLAPGVDRPLAAWGGVINEVNTTPGLHHHLLVRRPEQALAVGPALLEPLLDDARQRRRM